jgi:ubiquinol-cytochrome c reductase core subunit 2
LFPFLFATVAVPKFPQYDLGKVKETLRLDRKIFKFNKEAVMFDNLHKVAFRRGLGNSLNVTKSQIEAINQNSLLEFHGKNFNTENVLVVGSGVSAAELNSGVVPLPQSSATRSVASKFGGGEIRVQDPASDQVMIAIASLGGAENSKESIAAGVLSALLSGVPNVSYGNPISPISQQVANEYLGESVKAFNFSYSDSGLFGFYINTRASEGGKALASLKESLNTLKGSLTEDHVLIGRQLYYRGILSSLEDQPTLLEHVGSNILLGTQRGHEKWKINLDSITTADLKQTIDKFLTSKKAMSVVGNATETPYLDEI